MSRLPLRIATGVYQITLGGVNAFLIDLDDHGVGAVVPAAGERAAPGGLVLVDTGFARSAARVGAAIRDLGRAPGDLRAIVVTHLHGDHTGARPRSRMAAPTRAALRAKPVSTSTRPPGAARSPAAGTTAPTPWSSRSIRKAFTPPRVIWYTPVAMRSGSRLIRRSPARELPAQALPRGCGPPPTVTHASSRFPSVALRAAPSTRGRSICIRADTSTGHYGQTQHPWMMLLYRELHRMRAAGREHRLWDHLVRRMSPRRAEDSRERADWATSRRRTRWTTATATTQGEARPLPS